MDAKRFTRKEPFRVGQVGRSLSSRAPMCVLLKPRRAGGCQHGSGQSAELPAAAPRVCEQRGVEEIREALSVLSTGLCLPRAAQPELAHPGLFL